MASTLTLILLLGLAYKLSAASLWAKRFHAALKYAAYVDAQQGASGIAQSVTDRLTGRQPTAVDGLANLISRNQWAKNTLDAIPKAMITTDRSGLIEHMNTTAECLLGVTAAQVYGKPLSSAYATTRPNQAFLGLIGPGGRQAVRQLQSNSKRRLLIRESRQTIRDPAGDERGEVLLLEDVSETFSYAEEQSAKARTDALTGLNNREEFEHILAQALENHRNHSGLSPILLFIDIDHFKHVNDTAGHMAGDELLRQLASLIKKSAKRVLEHSDATAAVSRLGGDEFTLLLGKCRLPDAVLLAEAICRDVAEHKLCWEGRIFNVGASIGLTELDATVQNTEEAINRADRACYSAKSSGRGQFAVYETNRTAGRLTRSEENWQLRLRLALDQKRFVLHRQAIRSLKNRNSDTEFEVLLRMVDEDGTLIMPEAFLSAAQRFGIAAEIDRLILDNTIDFLAGTSGQQAKVCMVRISQATLTDEGFPTWLSQRLRTSGVAAGQLCIDIDESIALRYPQETLAFMCSLSAFGCRFALSNFSSGLAMFNNLKDLPLNYLKIGPALTRDLVSNPLSRTVVAAISEVGQTLGFQVIAEGVTDVATATHLQMLGIDYAQGVVVGASKPLTPALQQAEPLAAVV